jgi:hypothetical protein
MAELNSQITALLSLGADAMDNTFDVMITLPKAVSDAITGNAGLSEANNLKDDAAIENMFALRCNGFEPPKFTLKTYEVRYKTIGLKKPASRIDGERVFKIQFRLDSYYSVYRALMAWRSYVMQPATGFASNLVAQANTGEVTVVALDSPVEQARGGGYASTGLTSGKYATSESYSGLEGIRWEFKNVWLIDVEDPKYKTGSGETISITATFGFGEFMDPQYYDRDQSPSTYSILPKDILEQ